MKKKICKDSGFRAGKDSCWTCFVMSCSYRGYIHETVGETGAPADTVDGRSPTPPGIYKTL